MATYASLANTYQWNDANGIISGETTSSYIATASGSYSLTVTTPNGCSATSSGLAVNIINVSVPSGLFSSNLELTKGTMNWSAVADAHHYDVRFREQGSSSWQTLYSSATSLTKNGLAASLLMSGRFVLHVHLVIMVQYQHGHPHKHLQL